MNDDISININNITTHFDAPSGCQNSYHGAPVVHDIAQVAMAYCDFSNSLDSLHVLKAVAADLSLRSEEEKSYVYNCLDKELPTTAIAIPEFIQSLPLYPSKSHRRADEVRHMFKNPKPHNLLSAYIEAKEFLDQSAGKQSLFRNREMTAARKIMDSHITKLEVF